MVIPQRVGILTPKGDNMRPDISLAACDFLLSFPDIRIRLRRKKTVFSNTVNPGTFPEIFNQIFCFPKVNSKSKPTSAAYEISSDPFPIVGFALKS